MRVLVRPCRQTRPGSPGANAAESPPRRLPRRRLRPRIAFATDDYAAVQGLVREGLGVATLPAFALHTLTVAGIEHRPLRPASTRTISAAVVAGARAPAILATIGALRTAAAVLVDDERAGARTRGCLNPGLGLGAVDRE